MPPQTPSASPTFDVNAARQTGASDDDILNYLSQRAPNFDVNAALKLGSKADVIDYLSTHATAPSGASIPAAPAPGSAAWWKSLGRQSAEATTDVLPALGATAGGILGAGAGTAAAPGVGSIAGGIAGATLGGAAGEAGRQQLRQWFGFQEPLSWKDLGIALAKQGAMQGAVQGVTEGLGALAGPVQRAATGQYARALSPTTNINKAIVQEETPEMLSRGIHGSLEDINQQAAANLGELRPQLNQAYAAMPAQSTAGSRATILSDLDKLKSRYIVGGQVAKPEAVNAIEGLQNTISQQPMDISPTQLRQLKQIYDEVPAAKAAYAGADLTTQYGIRAQETAANSIRQILNQASPDVAALNKEMSFWLNVQRVTEQTGLRRTGQEGGLIKTFWPMASGLGTAAGFAAHGPEGGLVGGLTTSLASMVAYASRQPAWRTLSAVTKNALAESLARGDAQQTAAILTRAGIAVARAATSSTGQPAPLALGPQ